MGALEIAKEALKKIIKDQGIVCNEFEICNHKSCNSSYMSWMIASTALHEIETAERKQESEKQEEVSNIQAKFSEIGRMLKDINS